jgi:hypothetical protein
MSTVAAFRSWIPEELLQLCTSYLGGTHADWLNYLDECYSGIDYPCSFAARHNLPELMRLYQGSLRQGDRHEEVAAHHGSVQILDWLHGHWGLNPRAPQTCELAARSGQLAACRRASELGYGWGSTASAAAANGHADLLHWALLAGAPRRWDTLMASAAHNGDFPVLEILHRHRAPGDELCDTISMGAAAGGHQSVLKWLMARGCPISGGTMDRAAYWPGLVQWLRTEANCPWGDGTAAITAKRGDLELFDWLCDQGCPLGEDTCIMAAVGGNLELFRRACARMAAPWCAGSLVCSAAATHGHLDILKLAHGRGAPIDQETLTLAACAGRREIVEYLCMVKCPWSIDAYQWAAQNGHNGLAAWLKEQGCPTSCC